MRIKKTPFSLFLIRHGETDWNRLKKIQGRSDINLNETGIQQSINLRNHFSTHPQQPLKQNPIVYTSTLSRAIETATLITGKTKHQLIMDARIKEAAYGPWEGSYWPDVKKELLEKSREEMGIETSNSTYQRMDSFFQDKHWPKQLHQAPIIVVAHGGITKQWITTNWPALFPKNGTFIKNTAYIELKCEFNEQRSDHKWIVVSKFGVEIDQ